MFILGMSKGIKLHLGIIVGILLLLFLELALIPGLFMGDSVPGLVPFIILFRLAVDHPVPTLMIFFMSYFGVLVYTWRGTHNLLVLGILYVFLISAGSSILARSYWTHKANHPSQI